jgi:hypothetical protein
MADSLPAITSQLRLSVRHHEPKISMCRIKTTKAHLYNYIDARSQICVYTETMLRKHILWATHQTVNRQTQKIWCKIIFGYLKIKKYKCEGLQFIIRESELIMFFFQLYVEVHYKNNFSLICERAF